jgi:periplasmic divalent cation tolerance protein
VIPYLQVMTTTASRDDALKIAHTVVEKRLAGCVQVVGPVTSVYCWQGHLEEAEEWQCLIKSREDLCPLLEEAIRAVHPYEVPEILAVPIVSGSQEYLAWLEGELTVPGQDRLPGM